MGKNVSIYIEDDLLKFMDSIVEGLKNYGGFPANRSELISVVFTSAMNHFRGIAGTYESDVVKWFEQKKLEEDAKEKKKIRY
jgi:hypothetical protein